MTTCKECKKSFCSCELVNDLCPSCKKKLKKESNAKTNK